MKKYFFSLDLEEWTHLEYVKDYVKDINSDQKFASKVIPFLKKMAEEQVFMTVFVLSDVAKKDPELIKKIVSLGHEIACHGKEHDLVYNLTTEQFKTQTAEAKSIIDKITGQSLKGYRAPCFSMENEKLEVLWDLGFSYDASYIKFKEHKLYNVMSMDRFSKIESMIYKNGNHYEFETPTLEIAGKSIPISGGGYFRLFPLWLMKLFMNKHWKSEDNFVFYIHPFEVTDELLKNGKKMGRSNYFRFQIGRKTLQKKIFNYIKWLKKKNVVFLTFEDYINELENN